MIRKRSNSAATSSPRSPRTPGGNVPPNYVISCSPSFEPNVYDEDTTTSSVNSSKLSNKSPSPSKSSASASSLHSEERESYIQRCSDLGVEPVLEFLLALSNSSTRSCILSNRKNPLESNDLVAIGDAMKKNRTITELDLTHSIIEKQAALDFVSFFSVNTTLTKLSLGDSGLDDEILSELCKNLLSSPSKTALTQLFLFENEIGKSSGSRSQLAMSRLIDVLSSTRIKVLDLSHNYLDDACIQLLVEGLKDNYYCSYLNLKENRIADDGAAAIGDMLTRNVAMKDLDLSRNKISSKGAIRIVHGLRTNNFLLKLNLRNNRIDDEGAKEIAREFSLNRNNVQELYLGSNLIRVQGAMALADMLKKNTSLTKFDMQGILLEIDGAPPTVEQKSKSVTTETENDTDNSREYPKDHFTYKLHSDSPSRYHSRTSPGQPPYFNSDSEVREFENITRDLKSLYSSGLIPNNDLANDIEYQRIIADRLEKQRLVAEEPSVKVNVSQQQAVTQPKSQPSSPQLHQNKLRDSIEEPKRDVSYSVNNHIDLSGIEARLSHQIAKLGLDMQYEIDNVRVYAKGLVEESMRLVSIHDQQSMNNSMNYQSNSHNHLYYDGPSQLNPPSAIIRESSSAIELAKVEIESKLRQEMLNLEEKLNLKISEVDFNTGREINSMHRMLEDRLDQQQKVIAKMAEEQRWVEEEGIQLRVEHEARIQEQMKALRIELTDQMKTIEERFKNGLNAQISQQEQSIHTLDSTSTELNTKLIRSQQVISSLTDRIEFLEKHLLGSEAANRYRKTEPDFRNTTMNQSSYLGRSTVLPNSPPSRLISDSKLMKSRAGESSDPQMNISISESVKSLNFGNNSTRMADRNSFAQREEESRMNRTSSSFQSSQQHDYYRDSIPDDRSEASVGDISVDEASLRQLQVLLGRAHSKLKQTTFLTSGKHSPPASHQNSYN